MTDRVKSYVCGLGQAFAHKRLLDLELGGEVCAQSYLIQPARICLG